MLDFRFVLGLILISLRPGAVAIKYARFYAEGGLSVTSAGGFTNVVVPEKSHPNLTYLDDGVKHFYTPFPVPFFCKKYNYLEVSVNGFVSFQNVMNIYPLPYEPPETFPLSPRPWTAILSPFWADVDVSCPYEEEMLPDHCHVSGVQNDGYAHYKILLSSRVTAREGFDLDDPGLFEDDTLLSRIGVDLTQGTSLINFQPDFALIVTWDGVGYNKHHNDKVNSFQMVYAATETQAGAIFNYAEDQIEWVSGDTSIGSSGGFGGHLAAAVGWNAGHSSLYSIVDGSYTDSIQDIDTRVLPGGLFEGQWIFRADGFDEVGCIINITNTPSTPSTGTPSPTTMTPTPTPSLSNDTSLLVSLNPNYGNQMGGQAVRVRLPGSDTLMPTSIIMCNFHQKSVRAIYFEDNEAICTVPKLDKTGYVQFKLEVFNGGELQKVYFAEFYSVPVEEGEDVQVEPTDLLVKEYQLITLKWNKNFIPNVGQIRNDISVKMWEFNFLQNEFVQRHKILDKENDGSATFNISTLATGQDNPVIPIVFQVTADFINPPVIYAWTEVLYYKNYKDDQCEDWSGKKEIVNGAICPKMEEEIQLSTSMFVPQKIALRLMSYFHPGATNCYLALHFTGSGAQKQCCYNESGDLLVGPADEGAGRMISYPREGDSSLANYFEENVIPYIFCCKSSDGNCSKFFNTKESDTGNGYETYLKRGDPALAVIYGDPHIITFNNDSKYSIKNIGETELVNTDDDSFVLQGRMGVAPFLTGNQEATVLTAIVAEEVGAAKIQIEAISDQLKFYIEPGEGIPNVPGSLDDQATELDMRWGNKRVIGNLIIVGNHSRAKIIFPSGAIVDVRKNFNFITAALVFLPKSMLSKTSGFLKVRDKSWLTSGIEDSNFWYTESRSWSDYNRDESYKHIAALDQVTPDSAWDLDAEEHICRDDFECKLDYRITGRTDIALISILLKNELASYLKYEEPPTPSPSVMPVTANNTTEPTNNLVVYILVGAILGFELFIGLVLLIVLFVCCLKINSLQKKSAKNGRIEARNRMVRSQSGFSERSTLRTNIRPIPEDEEIEMEQFITVKPEEDTKVPAQPKPPKRDHTTPVHTGRYSPEIAGPEESEKDGDSITTPTGRKPRWDWNP